MLDDFAVFQPEDVDYRLTGRVVREAMPMTVQDDMVAVGEDALDLTVRVWVSPGGLVHVLAKGAIHISTSTISPGT